jgi:hypothetical protein
MRPTQRLKRPPKGGKRGFAVSARSVPCSSGLKPARLSVDATAVAGLRIQDQSIQDAGVRSPRPCRRRRDIPSLSCLTGLEFVKVDDLISHQGLNKGSILDEESRSRHGGLYGVVTHFTGSLGRDGHSHRIETPAAWRRASYVSGAAQTHIRSLGGTQ